MRGQVCKRAGGRPVHGQKPIRDDFPPELPSVIHRAAHAPLPVLQGWYAMEGRCVRGLSVPRWADVPPALALIVHGSTYKLVKAA